MAELLEATTEKRRNGANVVKLRGVLGNNSGLQAIDIGTTPRLMVNLAQIERVEALDDWSKWIASVAKRNIKVELVSCSPAVVAELNRDVEFAGAAIVKSISIPFHCTTCQSTTDVLSTIIDLRESKMAPMRQCDLCKTAMEMVDDPRSYFAFVDKVAVTESSPDMNPSTPRIARGSNTSVAPENRGSRPSSKLLVDRRSSMSAFQQTSRGSQVEIITGPTPRVAPATGRSYLVAVILLLALAAAALAALLLVM